LPPTAQTLRGIAEQRYIAMLSASKCNQPILDCTQACHGICHFTTKQSCRKWSHVDTCLQWVKPSWSVCCALAPRCIQSTGLSLLALAVLIMRLWLSVVSYAHFCRQNKAKLSLPGIDFVVNRPAKHQEYKSQFASILLCNVL